MKILIIGATGRTGQHVVEQALARGHSVTALVRTQSLKETKGLTIITGDPRRIDDMSSTLLGHDAVISCLGQRTSKAHLLVTEGAETAIKCMRKLSIKRYVIVSGALLFPSINPLILVLKMMMSKKLSDARAMENVVRSSDLDWTIVRPPHLKGDGQQMGYRAISGALPSKKWSMQYADLAKLLIDVVEDQKFIRQIVGVGSA